MLAVVVLHERWLIGELKHRCWLLLWQVGTLCTIIRSRNPGAAFEPSFPAPTDGDGLHYSGGKGGAVGHIT